MIQGEIKAGSSDSDSLLDGDKVGLLDDGLIVFNPDFKLLHPILNHFLAPPYFR